MTGLSGKVVFVILHYLTIEETAAAISSILSTYESENIEIVVVDNASPNGSGQQLVRLYVAEPRVHILLQDENLGYARGNNAGYRYAVEELGPSFIVLLNNDVIISQPDFIDVMKGLYEQTGYAVLGPDIYVPALKWHQSPKLLEPMTADEAHAEIERLGKLSEFGLGQRLRLFVKRSRLMQSVVFRSRSQRSGSWNREHWGAVVHGACFIVSPRFIEARELALNPETHMYYEMEILDLECRSLGLLVLYSPRLSVEHYHSVSVETAFPDALERQRHIYRNMIDSLRVLEVVAREDEAL